jgi:hypothetical protein
MHNILLQVIYKIEIIIHTYLNYVMYTIQIDYIILIHNKMIHTMMLGLYIYQITIINLSLNLVELNLLIKVVYLLHLKMLVH